MPPIPFEKMTPAQQEAAQEIVAGPRGVVDGPFIPALRSPEFMRRLQSLGEYLRFGNSLGARLTELVILLVARRWSQQFEWRAHAPIAAEQGLGPGIIDAISEGRRPSGMSEAETIIFEFVSELDRSQSVSDRTYDRAVAHFGEAGVIDLIGTIGYYSTLAMIMNVARTPAPAGEALQ